MSGDTTVANIGAMRVKATAVGFSSILMWGMLALLTSFTKNIPPLQLTAMTFAIAFLIGIFFWAIRGADSRCLRQPIRIWMNGVFGLFGYHIFYLGATHETGKIVR